MVQNEWSGGLNDSTLFKINLVRSWIFSFNSLITDRILWPRSPKLDSFGCC